MKNSDIQRLQRMLKEMDEEESRLQSRYGDRKKGSVRTKQYLDANALRRVLCEIAQGAMIFLLLFTTFPSLCLAGEGDFCREIARVNGYCYVAAQDDISPAVVLASVRSETLPREAVVDACVEGYMAFAVAGPVNSETLRVGLLDYEEACRNVVGR